MPGTSSSDTNSEQSSIYTEITETSVQVSNYTENSSCIEKTTPPVKQLQRPRSVSFSIDQSFTEQRSVSFIEPSDTNSNQSQGQDILNNRNNKIINRSQLPDRKGHSNNSRSNSLSISYINGNQQVSKKSSQNSALPLRPSESSNKRENQERSLNRGRSSNRGRSANLERLSNQERSQSDQERSQSNKKKSNRKKKNTENVYDITQYVNRMIPLSDIDIDNNVIKNDKIKQKSSKLAIDQIPDNINDAELQLEEHSLKKLRRISDVEKSQKSICNKGCATILSYLPGELMGESIRPTQDLKSAAFRNNDKESLQYRKYDSFLWDLASDISIGSEHTIIPPQVTYSFQKKRYLEDKKPQNFRIFQFGDPNLSLACKKQSSLESDNPANSIRDILQEIGFDKVDTVQSAFLDFPAFAALGSRDSPVQFGGRDTMSVGPEFSPKNGTLLRLNSPQAKYQYKHKLLESFKNEDDHELTYGKTESMKNGALPVAAKLESLQQLAVIRDE